VEFVGALSVSGRSVDSALGRSFGAATNLQGGFLTRFLVSAQPRASICSRQFGAFCIRVGGWCDETKCYGICSHPSRSHTE
jgi:hypothetical protein